MVSITVWNNKKKHLREMATLPETRLDAYPEPSSQAGTFFSTEALPNHPLTVTQPLAVPAGFNIARGEVYWPVKENLL